MLTDADIEFMKQNREEITAKRTHDITVYYAGEVSYDPITNEPIGEVPGERIVPSVVTEISSTASANSERGLINGIIIETGDIWFSVNIDLIEDIAKTITLVKYDGVDYEVLAKDKKGIGKRNRIEFLGRKRS